MYKQNDMILAHLRRYGSITPLEALREYGCMRLGARIYELKMSGIPIVAEKESYTNVMGQKVAYARYRLTEVPDDRIRTAERA